ncbi:tRNA dihydrouridine synthase DusB [Gammaproteobacteria bacterium 53_120_T64]|nr:tRNA dihydrouridine synthase DusB [Gammaproteobacteria bacterium 53_120_T64]
MLQIGPHLIHSPLVLAPMAGVADLPFRRLCRRFGAGMAASEMLTADTRQWASQKSRFRLPVRDEAEPRVVQIAGAEPQQLAEAAQRSADLGAQIIDINMGCPAKKVCKRAAGSALLREEALVAEILQTVVKAVTIPVTLKIRTGWDTQSRNALIIARLAEDAGIQALAIHGRTRACLFRGAAEYDTIAEVVAGVSIPVIANGDITSPQQAQAVLAYTGAAALMIGRAAQGQPWLFRQINNFLRGEPQFVPTRLEITALILEHLGALHAYYGEELGLRIARKHVGWYLDNLGFQRSHRKAFNHLLDTAQQLEFIGELLLTTNNNNQGIAA